MDESPKPISKNKRRVVIQPSGRVVPASGKPGVKRRIFRPRREPLAPPPPEPSPRSATKIVVVIDTPRSPASDASVETARRDLLRGGKTLLAAGPDALSVFRIGDLQAVRDLKRLVAEIEAEIEAELERIDEAV